MSVTTLVASLAARMSSTEPNSRSMSLMAANSSREAAPAFSDSATVVAARANADIEYDVPFGEVFAVGSETLRLPPNRLLPIPASFVILKGDLPRCSLVAPGYEATTEVPDRQCGEGENRLPVEARNPSPDRLPVHFVSGVLRPPSAAQVVAAVPLELRCCLGESEEFPCRHAGVSWKPRSTQKSASRTSSRP